MKNKYEKLTIFIWGTILILDLIFKFVCPAYLISLVSIVVITAYLKIINLNNKLEGKK